MLAGLTPRRGRLRSWAEVRELLGVSRKTVVRRAYDALDLLMPGTPREAKEAILAGRGVQFTISGHTVTLRRPGARDFKVWVRNEA